MSHATRVEAVRRLVEQEQPRVPDERRGNTEPLAHALRVAGDPVVRPRPKIDDLEQLVDPRAPAVEVERGEQLKVLAAAQVRIEVGRLDEPGDAVQRLGKLVLRVAAEEPGLAAVGPDQAEQDPQRRRLARPVWPEKAIDVARLDGQIDVVDRGDCAVAVDEAARLDWPLGVHRRSIRE
jgi:hypothetical protein